MKDSDQIESAILALESQRALLGDAATDAAIAALRAQLELPRPSMGDQQRLAGERKLVTVMFADISGFTSLSEKNDPETLRALMNACFDRMVPVIQEYGGTVDKFIGDEIMALFGAPKAHERHAEMACNAALDLFDALRDFNFGHNTTLELHIGINTGLVIAGGIGSEGRHEYSVMGDAVNIAARLKDAAQKGEIYVGAEVARLTGSAFLFNALPPLRLKGKNDPVIALRLQGRRTDAGQREQTLHTELIGREKELGLLGKLLGRLQTGEGFLIGIYGEAGIGKSRLVTEIRRQTGDICSWVEGRSLPYTRQKAFQPASEIVLRLLNIPSAMGVDQGLIKSLLRRELELVLPGEADSMLPFLYRMMHLPLNEEEERAVRYLTAGAMREKIFSTFTSYINARAQIKPLVVVWEDLHWADPSSLTLIDHTISACAGHPVGIIILFRKEKEEKIWQLHEHIREKYADCYHEMHLDPLDAGGSATLIRRLFFVDNLSPDVERIILEKAEGNPFFTEELLRSLLDNGMLYLEGRVIKAAENLDSLTIPGTLQGVIASRIDRLTEADKHTLQTASILGRIFRQVVLAALIAEVKKDASLPLSLQRLVELELLRQRDQEDAASLGYIFKHAVTHDVAYNSLLLADRKMLHRLAGQTIEKLAGYDKDTYAESLAYHYELAGEPDKAVEFLQIAANRAKYVHSNEEAVELYRRAIVQAEDSLKNNPSESKRILLSGLLENQADILKLTGFNEQARAAYTKAMECREQNDLIARARLERKSGMSYHGILQYDQAHAHFHAAESILDKWPAEKTTEWWHEWIELVNTWIFAYYWGSKTAEMQELSRKIEPHIGIYGSPIQQTHYYLNLAALNFRLENYLFSDKTVDLAQKAVDICRDTQNLQMLAVAHFFLGFALLWCNKIEESASILEQALAFANRAGDLTYKSRTTTYLATAYRRLDNLEKTAEVCNQCLDWSRQAGMPEYIGTTYANLAWLAWRKGESSQVEAFAHQALEHWKKVETPSGIFLIFVWMVAFPLSDLYHRQGNLSKCLEVLEQLLDRNAKTLEPDLEEQIKYLIAGAKTADADSLSGEIANTLEMAKAYRYL